MGARRLPGGCYGNVHAKLPEPLNSVELNPLHDVVLCLVSHHRAEQHAGHRGRASGSLSQPCIEPGTQRGWLASSLPTRTHDYPHHIRYRLECATILEMSTLVANRWLNLGEGRGLVHCVLAS